MRPGDLYAALPGAHTHGARFCADAAAAGATAVLTDAAGAAAAGAAGLPALVVPDPRGVLGPLAAWLYGEPGRALRLAGITGTNGKTTTAYLVDGGLRRAGRRTGLIGTIETRIGGAAVPSARTTPEAPDLQALLAVMREGGVSAVTMEVSSHALALGRVDGCVYDVAAFTNLSRDHLDFHPTLEAYYAAKATLFTPERSRCGVVMIDDEHGRRLAAEATVPVRTASVAAAADWRAVGARQERGATAFRALGPDGEDVAVRLRLAGAFNIANALVAVAMLRLLEVDPEHIGAGVAEVTVPGRMERVGHRQDILALVDYAHTPDAVARAIDAAREGRPGRVLVVLGCGGDRDRDKRPQMGEVAARGADVLVVTDDNPRTEDPSVIRAGMLAGAARVRAADRAGLEEVGDRRDAINLAVRLARPGDTLLVLGKGHESGQEVAGEVHPFDDRVVLREALGDPAEEFG